MTSIPRTILRLLADAHESLGWRLPALLVLIPISGLVEGLGLLLLFPLLGQFGVGTPGETSPIADFVTSAMIWAGIPQSLVAVLLVVAVVLQAQVILRVLRGRLEAEVISGYEAVWKQRLFDGFLGATWVHSMRERTSAQSNAILTESGRVAAALNMTIQIITASVLITIYAALSLAAAWQIVAFLCVFGGIFYLAMRPLARRGVTLGECLSRVSEDLNHATHEFLTNMKLVKVTATEPVAESRFADILVRFRQASIATSFHPALVQGLYMSAGYLILCGGVWLSVSVLDLAPAAIIVSLYVFLRLYNQLAGIQGHLQARSIMLPALANAGGLLGRAFEHREQETKGAPPPTTGPAQITLRNIEVCYDDRPALHDLSIDLEHGVMVGVTGPSGAGKSTLVDVIAGLIRPGEGQVAIDGVPLTELDRRAWRREIGYVAQDTLLMRSTVAENIAWGASDASMEAIRDAARMANAHDFVEAMPQGYETLIGDRGVRLSGGQRQRLGLARALLGQKRLLVLDEATSALDSQSESHVIEAVERLRGTVTVLAVAHRLSSLRRMDRILVFDAGRLVEDGSFETLVAQGGHFAALWKRQSNVADRETGTVDD